MASDTADRFLDAVDTCRNRIVAHCREVLRSASADGWALALRVLGDLEVEAIHQDMRPSISLEKGTARLAELASAASLNLLAVAQFGLWSGSRDDAFLGILAHRLRSTGISFSRLDSLSRLFRLGFYEVAEPEPRHFHLTSNLGIFGGQARWEQAVDRASRSRFVEDYYSLRFDEGDRNDFQWGLLRRARVNWTTGEVLLRGRHRALDRILKRLAATWFDALEHELALTVDFGWMLGGGRTTVADWLTVVTALYRDSKARQLVAVIHALGRDKEITDSEWRPLVLITSRAELISRLQVLTTCTRSAVEGAIETMTAPLGDPSAKPSEFRLWMRPLLQRGDQIAWGCYQFERLNLNHILEDLLDRQDRQKAGDHFVEALGSRFRLLGVPAVVSHIEYEFDGKHGDIDLLLAWESTMFLFECKALLGIARADRWANHRIELEKAADQALRSRDFVLRFPTRLAERLRIPERRVREYRLFPAILLSGPLFAGAEFKGVPTSHADYLFRRAPTGPDALMKLLVGEPEPVGEAVGQQPKPAWTKVEDYLFTWQ